MSHQSYEAIYEEYRDILPSLTVAQAQELNRLVENNDLEEAQWYMSFLAKQYRIPTEIYAEAQLEDAKRIMEDTKYA